MITIDNSPGRGRGVFATEDIEAGTLIETCPVIAIPARERAQLEHTELYNYYFTWGEDGTEAAICLGMGSLYNHSYQPNARYDKDYPEGIIRFVAIKPIVAGDEITTNYNGTPYDQTPVWFEAR